MHDWTFHHLTSSAEYSHAKEVFRPPVAKHVKKHTKLQKGVCEKAIVAEICADCSIGLLHWLLF